jgi:site-specific recombinase XerD
MECCFIDSHAIMSGVDLFTIKELAGHSDLGLISSIYGHLTNTHRIDAVNKIQLK